MGPPSMSGKALGFHGYTSSNPSPNSSPLHRLLLWYHNPQIMIFMCREPTLFQTLLTQSAHAVLTIPLSVRARRDKLILVPNPKGNFTVKLALLHCTQANQHLQTFQRAMEKTLENQALERVKMLLWRIEANALPTKENLQRRVPLNDSSCILCQQKQESSTRLFLKCPITKAIWSSRCWGFKSDDHSITSNEGIIKLVLGLPKVSCPMEDNWLISLDMAFVLDKIWRLRNQVLYEGSQLDIVASIRHILQKPS